MVYLPQWFFRGYRKFFLWKGPFQLWNVIHKLSHKHIQQLKWKQQTNLKSHGRTESFSFRKSLNRLNIPWSVLTPSGDWMPTSTLKNWKKKTLSLILQQLQFWQTPENRMIIWLKRIYIFSALGLYMQYNDSGGKKWDKM